MAKWTQVTFLDLHRIENKCRKKKKDFQSHHIKTPQWSTFTYICFANYLIVDIVFNVRLMQNMKACQNLVQHKWVRLPLNIYANIMTYM
jgi:hypothetical protein